MSFPQYPAYNESGVEWLGDLPEHWRRSDLRWLSRRYSGGTPDKTRVEYFTNGTIPWLNSGAVNQPLITEASEYITEEAFANSSAKWIPAGALVMALAGQGKTKGMIAQLGFAATCNQSMAAIVPTSEVMPRFLLWWLTSNYQNIRNMAGGDLRDGLNLELLGDIPCPLPPKAEQTTIVHFLDRETTKIDALVAEQQRLIELLKEKRQALITHVVTKGLRPGRRMLRSGVDWIGEIPEPWRVMPLGQMCVELSYGFTNPMPTTDDGPYMLTANDIGYGVVRYDSARRTSREAFATELTNKSRPKANDVLITKDGTLGRVALHDGRDACINQSVAFLRIDPKVALPDFVATCLLASIYQDRLLFDAGGTTIKHIYISRLAKMHLACPPLEEQREIVDVLNQGTKELSRLLADAERSIELLGERRSALISAAVTGKIDVRHADAA